MQPIFGGLGLPGSLGVFAAAALVILVAGTKLERLANELGRETGLGQVFAGMILLAIATSLPELATSVTASVRGNPHVAVSNLLGGVVLQTMVLALSDAVGRKAPLTGRTPSFGLLLQNVGLIFILAVTVIVAAIESHWSDVGWVLEAGPWAIASVYVLMQLITMRARKDPRWSPSEGAVERFARQDQPKARSSEGRKRRVTRLVLLFVFGSAFVFAGGWTVVLSTERVAELTGASESFLGFTIIAFATSLPEISTTVAATRRARDIAAASNIFGSNSVDVALLLVVGLLTDGALFAEALVPSVFAACLGIVLTAVYQLGVLERGDRSLLRMGWDSIAVLVLGILGIWVMFALGG